MVVFTISLSPWWSCRGALRSEKCLLCSASPPALTGVTLLWERRSHPSHCTLPSSPSAGGDGPPLTCTSTDLPAYRDPVCLTCTAPAHVIVEPVQGLIQRRLFHAAEPRCSAKPGATLATWQGPYPFDLHTIVCTYDAARCQQHRLVLRPQFVQENYQIPRRRSCDASAFVSELRRRLSFAPTAASKARTQQSCSTQKAHSPIFLNF